MLLVEKDDYVSLVKYGRRQDAERQRRFLPHLKASFHCFTSLPLDSAAESICLFCEVLQSVYHSAIFSSLDAFTVNQKIVACPLRLSFRH
jgi:hypothetical protein